MGCTDRLQMTIQSILLIVTSFLGVFVKEFLAPPFVNQRDKIEEYNDDEQRNDNEINTEEF